jgi:5'-3' exonuclease
MGVPGFFLWLWKNYKTTNFVFQKEKIIIEDITKYTKIDEKKLERLKYKNEENQLLLYDLDNIDYLLIDTNCLIHPMCFKILAENQDIKNQDKLEGRMIEQVLNYITYLVDYVKPKKGVFIAIDGVAPVAKIKQQRSRRFKSVHDRELFDKIKAKHGKPISNFWNNSAITPGTIFMEKLHHAIIKWSEESKLQVIYSSCNTPSEGEHKLLQFIRNNQKENKNFSYVLYGLDADLIFLALSTNNDNIYLLREANQMNKNEPAEKLNYVSIKIMKECIVETMTKEYKDTLFGNLKTNLPEVKLNNNNLINDFIFLCYLLGNDFLPHLPSLDIHKDGIEYLITSYIEVFTDMQSDKQIYLLDIKEKIKINTEFLQKIVEKLVEKEEGVLREHFATGRRRMNNNSGDEYEKEMFKIENLQFKIIDPIQLGSDNPIEWRKRYYKHYFGCETEESIENFCKLFVRNYLIGIKWVTMYYFDKCPSWDWYFPYEHPPFLSDILKYMGEVKMNKITFSEGKPLKPFLQLLCVLPQQSNYLVPNCLKKIMTNGNSSLAHLYPIDFEQDFLNKSKYWMAIPSLPPLEIDFVKYIYNKYQNELSKEDQFRNRLCDNFIFNN